MLPNLSPIIVPTLVCSTCGERMRVEVQKIASGQISGMTGYCDSPKCLYGWELSRQYGTGMASTYVAPKPDLTKYVPPAGGVMKFVPDGATGAKSVTPVTNVVSNVTVVAPGTRPIAEIEAAVNQGLNVDIQPSGVVTVEEPAK